jgi:hypothetical protein
MDNKYYYADVPSTSASTTSGAYYQWVETPTKIEIADDYDAAALRTEVQELKEQVEELKGIIASWQILKDEHGINSGPKEIK